MMPFNRHGLKSCLCVAMATLTLVASGCTDSNQASDEDPESHAHDISLSQVASPNDSPGDNTSTNDTSLDTDSTDTQGVDTAQNGVNDGVAKTESPANRSSKGNNIGRNIDDQVAALYANPALKPLASTQEKQKITDTNATQNRDTSNNKPKIAIIIDDLGYNVARVKRLTKLDQALTLALIPDTPHAKTVAKLAEHQGYEMILHVPMETVSARKWKDGLTNDMDKSDFDATVNEMLQSFPNAKGINNHGGSFLTQQRDKMDWLMGSLANRGLYFVDSKTIATSVAGEAATAAGLPKLSRDVFLDNERSEQAIEKELRKLQRIASKKGQAIGIAHPHKVTLKVFERLLPKISDEGFEFVFISQLAQNPIRQ